MSNDIGGDELNQGGDITANDVQQRNKGAEYFLRNSWMELQEWKDKLAAYESLPLTSALPIAHYRASVYQAQAMAYKEAVGADSNEKRAAFVRRAGALGLLAGQYFSQSMLLLHSWTNPNRRSCHQDAGHVFVCFVR